MHLLFQNPIPEMMSYGPGTLVAQTDQYNDTGKLLPVFFLLCQGGLHRTIIAVIDGCNSLSLILFLKGLKG